MALVTLLWKTVRMSRCDLDLSNACSMIGDQSKFLILCKFRHRSLKKLIFLIVTMIPIVLALLFESIADVTSFEYQYKCTLILIVKLSTAYLSVCASVWCAIWLNIDYDFKKIDTINSPIFNELKSIDHGYGQKPTYVMHNEPAAYGDGTSLERNAKCMLEYFMI